MHGPFARRTRGRRHRWAAVILLAGLATTSVACSGDDGPAPQSALVESMWAQDDPVVSADSPDPLVLPGPDLPDDVVLSDVARPDDSPSPDAAEDPFDPSGAAQTLYADPDAPSPEDGPELVVGRTQATDTGGTLVLVEDDTGGGEPGGEAVDVGHPDATRVEVDGLVVVRWPLPVDFACCHQGFVAGRGLDADKVMDAARAADVEAPRPSLPEEDRAGLASLGTVAAEVRYFPGWSAYPERLTVSHDGGQAELRVHRGDSRMVAHVRFWSPDGDVPSPFPTLHRVTVLDDGTIVHGTASTDDVAAVESIVDEAMASLVPATDEQFTAAQAEILASVPLPPCEAGVPGDGPDPARADLHGAAGAARWVIGITVVDGGLSTCQEVVPAGTPALGGTSTSSPADLGVGLGGDGPIELLGSSTPRAIDGSTYRSVAGHIADDVAEVEVQAEGIDPVTADVAAVGPRKGRRWFAAMLEPTAFGVPPMAGTVIARSADSSEVGRLPL